MGTSAVAIVGRLFLSSVKVGGECSRPGSGIRNERRQTREWGVTAAPALPPISSTRPFHSPSATKTQKNGNPLFNLLEDDEDDDEISGVADMQEWIANKPAGFGLREYDTAMEERLLEEIEADRKAQAALNASKGSRPAKKLRKTVEKLDTPPEGIEVYVGNLPKKRNVDRDLRAAFSSAQGLLHVRPVVGGNDKSREPECKGLAFLTFASDDDAQDFIRMYNGEKIKFGKMEKKLTCELAAPNSPFKKPVFQKQGMGVPRLDVRENPTTKLSLGGSSRSFPAVELEGIRDLSSVEPPALDLDFVDSPEASEDELLELEQEIWADLEDEFDFEVDRELEEENRDRGIDVNLSESRDPDALGDRTQSRQDLGEIDGETPLPNQANNAGNGIAKEDKVEVDEMHLQEPGLGPGFGGAHQLPDTASGDKDKRIQELEYKIKELQLQLETKENQKEHVANLREESLEALEKRVLGKARAARRSVLEDSKVSRVKRMPARSKVTSSKEAFLSKESSQPKIRSLGAASRLRKRERKIYTEVLSKYSTSTEERML